MNEEALDQWLSLSEASELLGVHSSTLRRWADGGRVPCQRTPGGHRRFSRRRLTHLLNDGAVAEPPAEEGPGRAADQPWHARFVEAGLIDDLRTLGQRLTGISLQYLTRRDDDRRFLDEGSASGAAYAAQSRRCGIDLLDAVSAFLFYRSSFAEVVTQLPGPEQAGGVHRLYSRYDRLMNEVLLGLIRGYEEG
jgi:excisionase family DNA binding protein